MQRNKVFDELIAGVEAVMDVYCDEKCDNKTDCYEKKCEIHKFNRWLYDVGSGNERNKKPVKNRGKTGAKTRNRRRVS